MSNIERCSCGKTLSDCERTIAALIGERDSARGLLAHASEIAESRRQQLAGAVDTALRDLASEAREICAREGVDDVAGWIGKTVLARVGGQ
jgi:hypothetical protein